MKTKKAKSNYMPQSGAKLKLWADTFKSELPEYANTLGITATELTAILTAAGKIADGVDAKTSARSTFKVAIASSDVQIDDNAASLRDTIAWIKTQTGYTEDIGQMLGIVIPNTPFDPNTYKAEIASLAQTGPARVEVKFFKRGAEAMNVYAQLIGATAWKKVGMATNSPFIDQTPLAQPGVPEMRNYRIRGLIKDEEIGDFSAVESIGVM